MPKKSDSLLSKKSKKIPESLNSSTLNEKIVDSVDFLEEKDINDLKDEYLSSDVENSSDSLIDSDSSLDSFFFNKDLKIIKVPPVGYVKDTIIDKENNGQKENNIKQDYSITIEEIAYNCEIIKTHSNLCRCATPRLHVYLTSKHRCTSLCLSPALMNSEQNTKPRSRKSSNPMKILTSSNLTGSNISDKNQQNIESVSKEEKVIKDTFMFVKTNDPFNKLFNIKNVRHVPDNGSSSPKYSSPLPSPKTSMVQYPNNDNSQKTNKTNKSKVVNQNKTKDLRSVRKSPNKKKDAQELLEKNNSVAKKVTGTKITTGKKRGRPRLSTIEKDEKEAEEILRSVFEPDLQKIKDEFIPMFPEDTVSDQTSQNNKDNLFQDQKNKSASNDQNCDTIKRRRRKVQQKSESTTEKESDVIIRSVLQPHLPTEEKEELECEILHENIHELSLESLVTEDIVISDECFNIKKNDPLVVDESTTETSNESQKEENLSASEISIVSTTEHETSSINNVKTSRKTKRGRKRKAVSITENDDVKKKRCYNTHKVNISKLDTINNLHKQICQDKQGKVVLDSSNCSILPDKLKNIGKKSDIGTKSEDSNDQDNLATLCTNNKPSIADIFGELDIKEEPGDDVIESGMSIEDFSNALCNGASKSSNLAQKSPEKGNKKGKSNCEAMNKSFEGLVKEEVDVEKDLTDNESVASPQPLHIDEEVEEPKDTEQEKRNDNENATVSNKNKKPCSESLKSLKNVKKKLKPILPTPRHFKKTQDQVQVSSINYITPFKIRIMLNTQSQSKEQNSESSETITINESGNLPTIHIKNEPMDILNLEQTGGTIPIVTANLLGIPASSLNKTNIPDIDEIQQAEFKCKYCYTICNNFASLAQHLENHQKDGLILCLFCQKSFCDKTGMRRHMRTHTGERPYECQVCHKRFSLPGNFKKHRDIHEDKRTEPCEVCGKTFRRKEHLKYHMRTHTGERPYQCGVCGSTFTARYSLQIHMNIHLGKKPYKCHYCHKGFTDKSTMRKHIRVHTGEKPFKCSDCDRCFGESGTLAAHAATHRTDRPFHCDKCPLSFKTSGGLRQHEKVHSGKKQFTCKYCGMEFLQKYNMSMHERIHTNERPYSCKECGRAFRSRSCLGKHVILHSGDEQRRYKCSHCDRKFFRKAHLKRHIDMHLGVKDFQCEKCKKKFCTRVTLKNHMSVFHTEGARKFPCELCGKVFKRKVYVSTHHCLGKLPGDEKGQVAQIDSVNKYTGFPSEIKIKEEVEDEDLRVDIREEDEIDEEEEFLEEEKYDSEKLTATSSNDLSEEHYYEVKIKQSPEH